MTDKINKNGFELHNLKHVSVSQANKWREAPDAWIAQYLYGHKSPYGYPALQGLAVESAVEMGLFNGIVVEDCISHALERFKSDTMLMKDNAAEIEKRKPIIERMVRTALEQLVELGKPEEPPVGSRQHTIGIPVRFKKHALNGTINCVGFLDFYYPDKQLVIDLKTTAKAPSGWSLSHGIQAAVYKKAVESMTGKPATVKFLYVLTRQKDPFVWLTMEDPDYYLKIFKRTIISLEALLSVSSDAADLLKIIPHNPDSCYWSGAEHIAAELYGDDGKAE